MFNSLEKLKKPKLGGYKAPFNHVCQYILKSLDKRHMKNEKKKKKTRAKNLKTHMKI
jgi:hypothetical protein